MSPSMTVLLLEGAGEDWQLSLNGDWSLAAMTQVEMQLNGLPGTLRGTLVCDWSRAEAPGLGPVWALLGRLAGLGQGQLRIHHTGEPPHYLELLQRLKAEEPALQATPAPETGLEASVGKLGRWAVLQGNEAEAAIGFFGR